MEKFRQRVMEIEQSIEVVRKLLLMFVEKLQSRGSEGFGWIKEELEQLLNLLNRYVELLVKLKREFGEVLEEQVDDVTELLWDIRILDSEDRLKVKRFVKELLKDKYGK